MKNLLTKNYQSDLNHLADALGLKEILSFDKLARRKINLPVGVLCQSKSSLISRLMFPLNIRYVKTRIKQLGYNVGSNYAIYPSVSITTLVYEIDTYAHKYSEENFFSHNKNFISKLFNKTYQIGFGLHPCIKVVVLEVSK